MKFSMEACKVMRGSKNEWELADALPGGPVGKYWVGKYGRNPWFIYDINPYWKHGITMYVPTIAINPYVQSNYVWKTNDVEIYV